MNPFQFAASTTPREAVDAIGRKGRYLGGGIDLLDEMKAGIVSPDILVALRDPVPDQPHAPLLLPDGSLILPSSMTMAEIADDPDIKTRCPALAQAAAQVGLPQIRNVATLAGNLLQHSHCGYYRQPDVVCLKRGGSTCYAHEGDNKYLSLFHGCACISPVISNTAIALAALGAQVIFQNRDDGMPISIARLYEAAWTHPRAHNSTRPSDLLISVEVPSKRSHSAYLQVTEHQDFAGPLVSCAAAGNVANGMIRDARVALGAISPVPHMVEAAHAYLEGKPLTADTASHAADLILHGARPFPQNGYKVPLAHDLIRQTLLALNA